MLMKNPFSFNQKKKLIFNLSDIGIDNSAAYLIGKTVLKIFSSKHVLEEKRLHIMCSLRMILFFFFVTMQCNIKYVNEMLHMLKMIYLLYKYFVFNF